LIFTTLTAQGDLGLSKAALVAVQSCRSGRGVGVPLIALSELPGFQICFVFILIWVFPKMVVPNNHGFSYLKMIILGCEMGVPPFI